MTAERCLTLPGKLPHQLTLLWRRQAADWPMLAAGIAALRKARTRSFQVGGCRVVVQCNPARVASASAKVDGASLASRLCPLCSAHLPDAQCGIRYRDNWLILCNPAPVFEPHFTVVSAAHEPQRVGRVVDAVLSLAHDLEGAYTVFYNGPCCGASSPDHLHLQVTPAGATPFEAELAAQLGRANGNHGNHCIEWLHRRLVRLGISRIGQRPAIVLMSSSPDGLHRSLEEVIGTVGEIHPADPEPMLNLFATFAEDRWVAWLFPRGAHRPAAYGSGPEDYLISPGAVDLAGVVIAPRPEDLDRLEPGTVQSILDEVLLPGDDFARLCERLADKSAG